MQLHLPIQCMDFRDCTEIAHRLKCWQNQNLVFFLNTSVQHYITVFGNSPLPSLKVKAYILK